MPVATSAQPLLSIRGLSRRFGKQEVVNNLDLDVSAGERVALKGPNGSGKTTVIRCISGALVPTTGEIRVEGHPAGSGAANRLVGASLSQERSFYLRLSGRENLLFFAQLRHSTRARAVQQVEALVEELEIAHIAAKRLDRCSTGMLQQMALARALLGSPTVLVLDEPTRSLDEGAIARLWSALDRRPDAAVLIATHRPDDLDHCNRQIDFPR
ncbi:MAG: ABC transporter ATP-binding protein [Thermoleophilaceae bacterium]